MYKVNKSQYDLVKIRIRKGKQNYITLIFYYLRKNTLKTTITFGRGMSSPPTVTSSNTKSALRASIRTITSWPTCLLYKNKYRLQADQSVSFTRSNMDYKLTNPSPLQDQILVTSWPTRLLYKIKYRLQVDRPVSFTRSNIDYKLTDPSPLQEQI